MARPSYSYPLYSAQLFTSEARPLAVNRETLPQLVAWCAAQLAGFDSYQRVRRELNRCAIYCRGYKLSAGGRPVFVLITLVNPALAQ